MRYLKKRLALFYMKTNFIRTKKLKMTQSQSQKQSNFGISDPSSSLKNIYSASQNWNSNSKNVESIFRWKLAIKNRDGQ